MCARVAERVTWYSVLGGTVYNVMIYNVMCVCCGGLCYVVVETISVLSVLVQWYSFVTQASQLISTSYSQVIHSLSTARPAEKSCVPDTPSMPCFCTFTAFRRGRLKPCARFYKIIPRKQLPFTLKPLHPIPLTLLLSPLRNPTFLANSLLFHLISSHFIQ